MVKPIPNSAPKTLLLKPYIWIGLLLLLGALLFMAKRPGESPVVYDKDGNVILAPHRREKLDRKLDELKEAEQYVLLAAVNGWYPCFSCQDSDRIYLKKGEVWKYGFSTKGRMRYSQSFYRTMRLTYVTQLVGTIEVCMQEEIKKIINYPTLPEALARQVVLERPPGNKVDS